jgi:hypothetical protein
MDIFAPMTAEQVSAVRMGTPAYQMLHPYNKAMSSGTPDKHYKMLVQPTMSRHNKSMGKHLGMPATFIGGRVGTLL